MKKHLLAFLAAILSSVLLSLAAKAQEETDKVIKISFNDALSRALEHHYSLKLAKIKLEETKLNNAKQISHLLPKVSLKAGYTRNIPEIKTSLNSESNQSDFYRQVASLVRDQGKAAEADKLEKQADLMGRRNDSDELIINPKNLFNAGLVLEIPLFNGPKLWHVLNSKGYVDLEQANLEQERSETLYKAALAYYRAFHLENIFKIREQAFLTIEKDYKKALAEKRRGEKDLLDIEAKFLLRKAEVYGAKINYKASLSDLGQIMGLENFTLEDPMFLTVNINDEELVSMALSSRSDLAAQRKALMVSNNEKLRDLLQFLPTFTIEGQANYTSNNRGLSKENFTYAISLNASMPLFDGGASLISLKEAALKKQAHEIRLSELQKEINTNIRMQKEKIEQLRLSIEAYSVAKKAHQEQWRSSLEMLNQGLIRQSEYLQKSEQRLLSELDYENAQFELVEAQLALHHEAGLLTSGV